MRILLITDTHLAPDRPSALANWHAASAYAARVKPDLTIHLGDITRDGWTTNDELPFAAGLAKDWPTPIRFIPGNHDIGDNPPGDDVPYKQPLSADLLATYRTLFGGDRWSLETASGWTVIGVNAQLFGTGTREEAAQWDWLAETIEDADGRPLALLSHKPLFQDQLDAEPAHIRYVPTLPRRRLLDLLKGTDWRLCLSGHAHQFWDREHEGVRHAWIPSLAFRFPDTMQERYGEKLVGAALLDLSGDTAELDTIIPSGTQQIEYNPRSPS